MDLAKSRSRTKSTVKTKAKLKLRSFVHSSLKDTSLFVRLLHLLLSLLLLPTFSTPIKWLWIHQGSWNGGWSGGVGGGGDGGTSLCDHTAFINKQVKFCKSNPDFMDSIRIAAGKSIQECQYQFRHNKWNCSIDLSPLAPPPSNPNHNHNHPQHTNNPLYSNPSSPSHAPFHESGNGRRNQQRRALVEQYTLPKHHHQHQHKKKVKFPFVAQGTREAAFIHSLSSAGVAHQLTKSCSAGASPDCGCDKSLSDLKSSTFKWAGCSDNIDYGVSLSRTFVDALDHRMSRKNKTLALALVNLHNNEAGRKIITKLMRIECKCHGVSGSCEIKTCWRVMPNLRQIGETLRSKFEYALMVEEKRVGGSRRGLKPKSPNQGDFTPLDLVYLNKSPDFCTSNLKKGSLGTTGRVCREVSVTDSCGKLCCGRGHNTTRVSKSEMCKCKFQWCCSVICSECIKEVEIKTCK